MTLFEELKGLGVDIDDGLKRLNGNEKLYQRLFGSFLKTLDAHSVKPDFDSADCEAVIEKVHTIKGTAGNLSITPIYESYSEILRLLRAEEFDKARELLGEILPVQEKIRQCIENHMA